MDTIQVYQLILILSCSLSIPECLEISHWGSQFVLTFLQTYHKLDSTGFNNVIVTTREATNVVIKTHQTGYVNNIYFHLEANESRTTRIPEEFTAKPYLKVLKKKAISIEASANISVYGFSMTTNERSGDGFLVLPVLSLGLKYLVATCHELGSQIAVIAVKDNTNVRIKLNLKDDVQCYNYSEGKRDYFNKDELNFAMNSYDVINIYCVGDTSGSSVVSNKPIGVVSGCACGRIPDSSYSCNHLAEMLPSQLDYGTEFVIVIPPGRMFKSILRIVTDSVTEIKSLSDKWMPIEPPYHDLETMNGKEGCLVSKSPILLVQYTISQTTIYDYNQPGGPSMTIIPPVNKFSTDMSVNINYLDDFNIVTVIVSKRPGSWSPYPVGCSASYKIEIRNPTDLDTWKYTDHSSPSMVIVYAYNTNIAVSFPAGMNLIGYSESAKSITDYTKLATTNTAPTTTSDEPFTTFPEFITTDADPLTVCPGKITIATKPITITKLPETITTKVETIKIKEGTITTEVVPITTEVVPITTEAVPITTEAVPITTEAVPITTEAVPITTEVVPITTQAVPITTQAVPITTKAVPITTEAVPITTQAVPITTQAVPITTQAVPITTQAVLITKEAVPITTQAVPIITQSVPITTQAVPITTEAIPITTQAVPITTEVVPITTQTIPITTETVPITTETEPIPLSTYHTTKSNTTSTDSITHTGDLSMTSTKLNAELTTNSGQTITDFVSKNELTTPITTDPQTTDPQTTNPLTTDPQTTENPSTNLNTVLVGITQITSSTVTNLEKWKPIFLRLCGCPCSYMKIQVWQNNITNLVEMNRDNLVKKSQLSKTRRFKTSAANLHQSEQNVGYSSLCVLVLLLLVVMILDMFKLIMWCIDVHKTRQNYRHSKA